jgi:hypothetical protein
MATISWESKRIPDECMVRYTSVLFHFWTSPDIGGKPAPILSDATNSNPVLQYSPFQMSNDGIEWVDIPPDTWVKAQWVRMRTDVAFQDSASMPLTWSMLYVSDYRWLAGRVSAGNRSKRDQLAGGGS